MKAYTFYCLHFIHLLVSEMCIVQSPVQGLKPPKKKSCYVKDVNNYGAEGIFIIVGVAEQDGEHSVC